MRRFGQRPPAPLHSFGATFPSSKSQVMPQSAPPGLARDDSRSLDSSFELIELIDISRAVLAVARNNHSQTNRGFSSGDSNGKDCNNHAQWWFKLRGETPERDEIQVCGGQHHLDADENEDGVAAAQCREQSNGKQCRG